MDMNNYIYRTELGEFKIREVNRDGKTLYFVYEKDEYDGFIQVLTTETFLDAQDYINGFEDEDIEDYIEMTPELENKRRHKYQQLCNDYLYNIWDGEWNEISDTLRYYEESVVHYGTCTDIAWTFLIDELENYGEERLIEQIYEIVK